MGEANWLEQYAVARPGRAMAICDAFEDILNKCPGDEEAIQKFIAENPIFLSEQLPHCHHVMPKFRFGSEYVSDFLLPEMTSGGTFWVFIEIEPADAKLVTSKGQFAGRVRDGLQQLRNWQTWVEHNRDYAIRPRPGGLGLGEIAGVWTWLVVGRRSSITPEFNRLREQLHNREGIRIMTYDRLLQQYRNRAQFLDSFDPIKIAQQFAAGPISPREQER